MAKGNNLVCGFEILRFYIYMCNLYILRGNPNDPNYLRVANSTYFSRISEYILVTLKSNAYKFVSESPQY